MKSVPENAITQAMSKIQKALLILSFPFLFLFISCERIQNLISKDSSVTIKTEEEKISYILGYILMENTKKSEAHLQNQAFLQGIKDNMNNKNPILSQEEIKRIYQKIQKKVFLKKQKQNGEKNNMEGKQFLEENKKKENIKITSSGLQYEMIVQGKGKSPTEQDTVEVHYRGTLIDGTEFDSSYKRQASISFPLNGVIKGWTEGLQLMKEGAKYKFYIPPELAYGERGAGQSIPPHATLIFEVELLKVK